MHSSLERHLKIGTLEIFNNHLKIMGKIRVLELFCGIGGLHWALKETGIDFEIVGALEINPTVLETYTHNFPRVTLLRRNIVSLSAEEINDMNIDAILMSPPCQPFCRTGNRQGLQDNRCSPLNNLLDILPKINFKYIFVENVQGFEVSDARSILVESLTRIGFQYQEFLLNPIALGVPNSRLRYYLIGKQSDLCWTFDLQLGQILDNIPAKTEKNAMLKFVMDRHSQRWLCYRQHRNRLKKKENSESNDAVSANLPLPGESTLETTKWCLGDILEDEAFISPDHILPQDKLIKYWNALDIVTPSSTRSCCFTKAYFHYLTGCGSILDVSERVISSPDKIESDAVKQVKGKFRYFTPREVSRLMCYPDKFQFPSNHSMKQKYKALGNSVNVYTVAVMFSLLFN